MKIKFNLPAVSLVTLLLISCAKNDTQPTTTPPPPPSPQPTYTTNDVVYITGDIGKLVALDAVTGALKWTFVLDTKANINTSHILSSPTLVDGTVYVGSSDYKVYAIDAGTGVKKWAFQTDSTSTPFALYESSPAISNGVLYIGGARLYAINISTGTLKWASAPEVIISSPVVVNNIVYVNGFLDCYSFDATTGVKLKSTVNIQNVFDNYRFHTASPCYYNGRIFNIAEKYTSSTYKGTILFPQNPLTLNSAGFGFNRLDYLLNASAHPDYTSPTVNNGILYVACKNTLYAFTLGVDTLRWTFSIGSEFFFSCPTADSNRVYIGDKSGILYAFNASTGISEWTFNAASRQGNVINNSPTLANNILYFSSNSGIHAVNATTGKEIWFRPTFGKYSMEASASVIDKSGKIFYSSISGMQN